MRHAAVIVVVSLAIAVVAAPGGAARADALAPAVSESAKLDEAARRFQRGIEFYKEGDSGAALVEFKRAYDLVPSYKILYNLGQVAYQRHDYAAALRYFRQYLGDGDKAIPADRQREVVREINELEQRVGRVDLETPETGADVFIDDVLIGTTPLRGPILVNSGARKIGLVASGGVQMTRVIEVAGGELRRLSLPRLTLPAVVPAVAHPPAPPQPSPAARKAEAVNLALATPPPPKAAAATVTAPKAAGMGSFPWKAWTLTGLLGAGAAATGVIAYMNKQDLDSQLAMFPSDPDEVDYYQRRTRGFALATDGLLIGTAVMAAISFYLTYRDPK